MWELIIENLHGWYVWVPTLYIMQLFALIWYGRWCEENAGDGIDNELFVIWFVLATVAGVFGLMFTILAALDGYTSAMATLFTLLVCGVGGTTALYGARLIAFFTLTIWKLGCDIGHQAINLGICQWKQIQCRIGRYHTERSLTTSRVKQDASTYVSEIFLVLPQEGWEEIRELIRSFRDDLVPDLLDQREKIAFFLAQLKKDEQKRHKNTQPGTPEAEAKQRVDESVQTCQERLNAANTKLRQILLFLDSVRAPICVAMTEEDSHRKVIEIINSFCEDHGITLDPLDADKLLADLEVAELTSSINSRLDSTRVDDGERKRLAGAVAPKVAQ